MKISIIYLLISIILISCSIKSKDKCNCTYPAGKFIIKTDTININFKTEAYQSSKIYFSHVIKYHDNYYCLFMSNTYTDKQLNKFLYIISSDGIIEQKIILPKIIEFSQSFDLFVFRDSVFINDHESYLSYYLDNKKNKFIENKNVENFIYEDNRIDIISNRFGEFGCTTFFLDKKTQKIYELNSEGPIVNKIDSAYYITSCFKVLKIEDVLKLKEYNATKLYKKNKFIYISKSLVGAKIVYKDTTYSYFDDEFKNTHIKTSFVCSKELLHLCVDSTSTFISKIENGMLKRIVTIGGNYSIFNVSNSYRMRIQNDNSQLLKFGAYKNEDVDGIIEICGNNINIRFFILKL